jgi:hypothetical protein
MATMKAAILDAPGPPNALQIQDLPILTPGPEQVLIKVAAFGLNRSELHTWLGLARGLTFPACWGSRRRARWQLARAASFRFVSRICPGWASSPTVKEP